MTAYGNVSGTTIDRPLPRFPDPYWSDPKQIYGKILDISDAPGRKSNFSSLQFELRYLTYTAFSSGPRQFCQSTRNSTHCPIIPLFEPEDPPPAYSDYPAFGVDHNMGSSFRFATIDSTVYVNSGEINPDTGMPRPLACVSANITPDLGSKLKSLLTYLPVAILVFVAIGTVSAAIFSPWGTLDPFKWTTNYGRDADLLRLVTPGFGDCLQYIQFIVFSGSLSLQYPGFFRPVVSQVSWSALMFNESFVSHGPGTQSIRDGIYVTNGTHGLDVMSQLVGMTEVEDIWAGMVIWLLVIIGAVIFVCQLWFLVRWMIRLITNQREENLQNKNWPMTGGNIVRIVCNFFLLPVVALSLFQLVVAAQSPAVVTAFAVILLVAILVFAGWILRIILTVKQRSRLFDDLPTVLLYGPLYNTYSDDAAPFALIPALLTFVRAVAIGAVQPSGVAQLVILAICEVILILTLHAFRPFRKQTSMNAYHTFFAVARLVVTLLSVAFVSTLGVTEPTKGWIGYVILFIHGIVLVFGFLLNSLQTLVEVVARTAGAGVDASTGGTATRGALVKVFGSRQLSRRARRTGFRNSMTSDAAILTEDQDAVDGKSTQLGGRSRSLSANSAILLNSRTPDRLSTHLTRTESGSGDGHHSSEGHDSYDFPEYHDNGEAYGRHNLKLKTNEPAAPYYRPPRQRRPTGDLMTPGARSRGSWASGDWTKKNLDDAMEQPPQQPQPSNRDSVGRPMSISPDNKVAPSPAYMRQREGSDPVLNTDREPRRDDVDYAVREVDFYYGVRGPALSNQPTRKLKTGPADPVGPVSSAAGWFKGMLGRKTKESGKGFEVVRSSKAPPQRFTDESPDGAEAEPYQDSPQSQTGNAAVLPGQKTRSTDGDREPSYVGAPEAGADDSGSSAYNSDGEDLEGNTHSFVERPARVSDSAPSLGPIDAGGDIQLPSRIGSRSTTGRGTSNEEPPQGFPSLPRKSSRRESLAGEFEPSRLSTIPDLSERQSRQSPYSSARGSEARLPFGTPLSPSGQSFRTPEAEPLSHFEPPRPSYAGGAVHRRGSSGPGSFGRNSPHGSDTSENMRSVNHYRASDSITQSSEAHSRAPSAAEIVYEGQPRPPRHSRTRTSGSSQATLQEFGW